MSEPQHYEPNHFSLSEPTDYLKRHKKLGTASPLALMLEQVREEAPMVTRCALCPRWRFRGAFAEGRAAFKEHRRKEHQKRRAA